jgi:hypothetical protein
MMPSSPIHHRIETHHSGRLSSGNASACVGAPDWTEKASLFRARNTPFARSRPRAHPSFGAKRPARPLRSNLPAPHPEAKSP